MAGVDEIIDKNVSYLTEEIWCVIVLNRLELSKSIRTNGT